MEGGATGFWWRLEEDAGENKVRKRGRVRRGRGERVSAVGGKTDGERTYMDSRDGGGTG